MRYWHLFQLISLSHRPSLKPERAEFIAILVYEQSGEAALNVTRNVHNFVSGGAHAFEASSESGSCAEGGFHAHRGCMESVGARMPPSSSEEVGIPSSSSSGGFSTGVAAGFRHHRRRQEFRSVQEQTISLSHPFHGLGAVTAPSAAVGLAVAMACWRQAVSEGGVLSHRDCRGDSSGRPVHRLHGYRTTSASSSAGDAHRIRCGDGTMPHHGTRRRSYFPQPGAVVWCRRPEAVPRRCSSGAIGEAGSEAGRPFSHGRRRRTPGRKPSHVISVSALRPAK